MENIVKIKLFILVMIVMTMDLVMVQSTRAKTRIVSSTNDSGPNTFRAAIEAANEDVSINRIEFQLEAKWVSSTTKDGWHVTQFIAEIKLTTPVVYTGVQELTIDGQLRKSITVITSGGALDLFVANNGGHLNLKNIGFVKALRSGVVVNVPPGTEIRYQTVSLDNVYLTENGWYGLHFDDQSGGDGQGADSHASLLLLVTDSFIAHNNNPEVDALAYDKDGIRVDEGGIGDVRVRIENSFLNANSAEGIEIDEMGEGNVSLFVSGSFFNDNGHQTQKSSDLEDGLDIDEAGPGSISVSIFDSTVENNGDEGIDIDEADEGLVYFVANNLEVSGNRDENIKVTQLESTRDAAMEEFFSIFAKFYNINVTNSQKATGIMLESIKHHGDENDDEDIGRHIMMLLYHSTVINNNNGDIKIEAQRGYMVSSPSHNQVGHIELKKDIKQVTTIDSLPNEVYRSFLHPYPMDLLLIPIN